MKIAIASSGLGHVARGIETWALDTAGALSHCSLDVTLFCAAPLPLNTEHSTLNTMVLPCLKRGDQLTRLITRLAPRFTWRWGWTSGYEIEQWSFWRKLYPILRDEGYDILHVQDPLLADLCRRYRKAGKLRTKEILAHGTEEPVEFLEKFDYVQHLAPWHLEQTVKGIEEKRGF